MSSLIISKPPCAPLTDLMILCFTKVCNIFAVNA
ncbi:MAG: hypothetical protein ACI9SD_000082 [Pseudohongiellaceae bacterium]